MDDLMMKWQMFTDEGVRPVDRHGMVTGAVPVDR